MADLACDQARCYFEQDMRAPDRVSVAGRFASVFSARCPGKESPNEDAAAVIPISSESAVLVVADGMGGGAAGEQAARLAVRALQEAIHHVKGTETLIRTAVINGFDRANAMVQQLGIGAATTLAAVVVDRHHVRFFHVGDSLILLVGGRGKLKFQTIAHSPVGYGIEAGLLDEHDAVHHDERHVVSNVIGMTEMRIEIGPTLELRPRDRLMLATDGLADNLGPDELLTHLSRGSVVEATVQLAGLARQRMANAASGNPSKPDDLTLIAFGAR